MEGPVPRDVVTLLLSRFLHAPLELRGLICANRYWRDTVQAWLARKIDKRTYCEVVRRILECDEPTDSLSYELLRRQPREYAFWLMGGLLYLHSPHSTRMRLVDRARELINAGWGLLGALHRQEVLKPWHNLYVSELKYCEETLARYADIKRKTLEMLRDNEDQQRENRKRLRDDYGWDDPPE